MVACRGAVACKGARVQAVVAAFLSLARTMLLGGVGPALRGRVEIDFAGLLYETPAGKSFVLTWV